MTLEQIGASRSPRERGGASIEKRYIRKDGTTVWGRLTAAWAQDERGRPLYGIGLVEDVTDRKRAEDALHELSGKLLQVQDEERRRIARSLHDVTAQDLAAIGMNLAAVEPAVRHSPRAREALEECAALIETCSREVRTISYLLHPPLLDELGLETAVRWYVEGFAKRSGIAVELEVAADLGRLPEEIERAIFRVIQESLTNVHHHAQSATASVRVAREAEAVLIEVRDAGRGVPSGAIGGGAGPAVGVGIAAMRERVKQLGGIFEIAAGKPGTVVRATLPLGPRRT